MVFFVLWFYIEMQKKEAAGRGHFFFLVEPCLPFDKGRPDNYLSSETVSLFLPLRRRAASTFLPLAVDILLRKPCLLALFLSEGWNVLFILSVYFIFTFQEPFLGYFFNKFEFAKVQNFFQLGIKKTHP
jgi:hypothetical protein